MAVTTTNCMLLVLLMMFVTLVDINSNLAARMNYVHVVISPYVANV